MSFLSKISSKISHRAVMSLRELKAMLGFYNRFYKEARGARILIYHGVCLENHTRFNSLFVVKKTFEAHLQFYKKYFHIVSLDDFYKNNFKKDRFNICITFDDGFANNYKYVVPLLETYNVPATFFVTAIRNAGYDILWNDFLTIVSVNGPDQFVFQDEMFKKNSRNTYISSITKKTLSETLKQSGFDAKKEMMLLLEPYASFKQKKELEDYWLQMTNEEIKKAAVSSFVTIGSHSYHHNDLAKISSIEGSYELRESKTFLENIIQKPVTQFAFPYGSYSPIVIDEAIKAGYEQLLAAEFIYPDDKHNPLMKERMGVNPFISVTNQMLGIIKGNYE